MLFCFCIVVFIVVYNLFNDIFLCVFLCELIDYMLIWLMCQVGCYLFEYNVICVCVGSFFGFVKNFDYVIEVMLQLFECFLFDVVILFLDILMIFDVMGFGFDFQVGEGLKFVYLVCIEVDVVKFVVLDIEVMFGYVMGVVCEICCVFIDVQGCQCVLLIGFLGSLWMFVCYMVEGGGLDDFCMVKLMVYLCLDLMYWIFDVNVQVVVVYLNVQIEVGVQVVMIFDMWGGVLVDGVYQCFLFDYICCVVLQFKCEYDGECVLVIMFMKGGGLWFEEIVVIGVDVVGFDWMVNFGVVCECVVGCVVLQGNFDLMILFVLLVVVCEQVCVVFDSYGNYLGYVFNFGYGIL